MDLTIAITLGTFALAAAVLFFISFFSFKERTYEEIVAEQRKNAGLATTKPEKSTKDKDKKNKKVNKKTKDKEKGASSTSEPEEEKPHVEFELTEEIIPEEPLLVKEEKDKKKPEKKEKIKPILRNKDEVVPVPPEVISAELSFDPDVNSANHFAEHPPKDVIELKHKEEKKTKSKPKNVPEPEVPVVEPIAVKEVAFTVGTNGAATQPQTQQQQGTPKKQQRKKGSKMDSLESVDGGEELLMLVGGSDRLISALQKVPLAPTELQTLIEVLLNRQQENGAGSESEWYEKGGKLDPVRALKKQLAEVEKLLKEEQEASNGFQTKIKTLKTEIQSERSRVAQDRKQLEEALTRQNGEIQVLTSRLQQIGDQHAAETAALHSTIQQLQKTQLSEDHLLKRLQEEKAQLEARCAGTQQHQQELASRVQQLEDLLRIKDQQRMEAEMTFQRLAAQLQDAEQTKAALLNELGQSREAVHAAENKALLAIGEAHTRCEEFERNAHLLESRLQSAENEVANERGRASRQQKEASNEIARLSQENQDLAAKLSSTQQKAQHDQDAETHRLKEELAQKEKQIQEVSAALGAAREELANKGKDQEEVAGLKEKLAQAERLQEELVQKEKQLQEVSAALGAAREELATKEKDQEEVAGLKERLAHAERLQEELAQKEKQLQEVTAALGAAEEKDQEEVAGLKEKLAQAEQELEAQKKKNNELRERNWKAMEAVAAAEKSVAELQKSKETKVAANPVQVQQQLAGVVQRVFPQIEVDATVEVKTFEQQVESQLKEALAKWRAEEETKSQGQVQHYKTVLSQTEVLLNRLQSRVEAEESAWKEKMAQLESKIGSVVQERDFWMQQCQQHETQQQQQQVELRLESLQKEKEIALKEAEKHRQTVEELKQQLEQTKAQIAAAKLGSLGYMVGWVGGVNPAATVAMATHRNSDTDAAAATRQVASSVADQAQVANGDGAKQAEETNQAASVVS